MDFAGELASEGGCYGARKTPSPSSAVLSDCDLPRGLDSFGVVYLAIAVCLNSRMGLKSIVRALWGGSLNPDRPPRQRRITHG